MNPHRNPSNSRQSCTVPVLLLALLWLAPCTLRAADHKSIPPPNPANTYAAFDTHPDEHVTIAAVPCDDPKLCPFFRLPYLQHGFLPVRVIITNDSDCALALDNARMQFISANNDKIPAATDDDINRRMFDFKGAKDTHIPLIPIPIHHASIDKRIGEDGDDFGFQGTVVNAHSTLAGYLFYDIRDLDDPALPHAELYVKMVYTLDGKRELFAFSIPFDKWLAANPSAPSNHPRQ